MENGPLIVIVGVCASGKSTLSSGLRQLGYNVRSFAQEHSVSGRLWQYLKPEFLIVLNCSYNTIRNRKRISWGSKQYQKQQDLLAHARQHADLLIETDGFTPEQLINHVHQKLQNLGFAQDGEVL